MNRIIGQINTLTYDEGVGESDYQGIYSSRDAKKFLHSHVRIPINRKGERGVNENLNKTPTPKRHMTEYG